MFPKDGQFEFEFQKGKLWQHQTLYAPFDFTIQKSEKELDIEKSKIKQEQPKYYRFNTSVFEKVKLSYIKRFNEVFINENKTEILYAFGIEILNEIYQNGVLSLNFESDIKDLYLIIDTEERFLSFDQLFRLKNLDKYLSKKTNEFGFEKYKNLYYSVFFEIIEPNILIDEKFTNQSIEQALKQVSPNRDFIKEGKLIIAQGEVVSEENYLQLLSLIHI